MEIFIWLAVTLPLPLILFGLAVFAWFRRTPMWFFAGIPGPEVSDVRGFNRANAAIWACFSLPFFAAAGVGTVYRLVAAAIILGACLIGIPLVVFAYHKVCRKYAKPK